MFLIDNGNKNLFSLILLYLVCPHAGGVGLCQMVAHIIMFDFISVSGSLENRPGVKNSHKSNFVI